MRNAGALGNAARPTSRRVTGGTCHGAAANALLVRQPWASTRMAFPLSPPEVDKTGNGSGPWPAKPVGGAIRFRRQAAPARRHIWSKSDTNDGSRRAAHVTYSPANARRRPRPGPQMSAGALAPSRLRPGSDAARRRHREVTRQRGSIRERSRLRLGSWRLHVARRNSPETGVRTHLVEPRVAECHSELDSRWLDAP